MNPLIASAITGIAVFAVVLKLGFVIRGKYRAAKEAARLAAQREQMIDRLMAASLEGRTAVTFVALAMINAGPCHLLNDEMRGQVPWIDRFMTNLGLAIEPVSGMSVERIYSGPFEGKDNVPNFLANNREFMYFILRSYESIDEFLRSYWVSFEKFYSTETRDAVRLQMVGAESFVTTELKDIHQEFRNLVSA